MLWLMPCVRHGKGNRMTLDKLAILHCEVVHNCLEHTTKCVNSGKDKNCLVCREKTWIKKYPYDLLNNVCSDCFSNPDAELAS